MVSGAAAETSINTMSRVPIAFFFSSVLDAALTGGTVAAVSLVKGIHLVLTWITSAVKP